VKGVFIVGREDDPIYMVRYAPDANDKSPVRYVLALRQRDGSYAMRDDISLVELRAIHAGIQTELFDQNAAMGRQAAFSRNRRGGSR